MIVLSLGRKHQLNGYVCFQDEHESISELQSEVTSMAKELSARECEILELTEKLSKENKNVQLLREDNNRLHVSLKTMKTREEQVALVTVFFDCRFMDRSFTILKRMLNCLGSWRQMFRCIARRMSMTFHNMMN